MAELKSVGTAKISRSRLKVNEFLNMKILIPNQKDMKEIIDLLSTIEDISLKLMKSENIADNLLGGTIAQLFEHMK